MASTEDDPDHPILPAPFAWELIEFVYRRDPVDWRASSIDLLLTRDGVERRLRFLAPRELQLSRGLPNSSGLFIRDVSRRQMEDIGVQVGTFEGDGGVPSFWAASVVDITEVKSAEPDAVDNSGAESMFQAS